MKEKNKKEMKRKSNSKTNEVVVLRPICLFKLFEFVN